MNTRAVQIIDLDNCLAIDEWRLYLIKWDTDDMWERYDNYHRAHVFDWACPVVSSELRRDARIVVLTARPGAHAKTTLRWLERRCGIVPYTMLMRNRDDHRPSVDLKRQQLQWLFNIAEYDVRQPEVVDAIDDRLDVVDMYQREFNLPARQLVASGASHER